MPDQRSAGLVSVVVPIFNAEDFLEETIASVLAQTYTRWELLLVDDGSSDGSASIAKRQQDAEPSRIRCLAHSDRKNHGVCTTRNLGIADSRGEYVAFLDADDVWLPNKLEQQTAILRSHPDVGLLYGHSIYFQDDSGPNTEWIPPLAPGEKVYQPPELLELNYPLGKAGAPCPSSFLARFKALEAIGGFEERFDHPQAFEDQAFLAKMYLNVPIFVSNAVWDKYRCHPMSYTSRALKNGDINEAKPDYLRWLSDYLRARQIQDPGIWNSIERLMWPYRHPHLARMKRTASAAAKRLLGQHAAR